MAANEIHQDDIGTVFEVTLQDDSVVVDLSTTTTRQLIFKKPDGTNMTKTAVFTTDGTDGKIQYVSISGDLDTPGNWKLQAHVIFATGDWRSDIGEFKVHENL